MAAGLCTRFVKVHLSMLKRSGFSVFCLPGLHSILARNRRITSNSNGTRAEDGKVLYLNSSGWDGRSFTGETAKLFLARYKNLHPRHSVQEINLWDKNLLKFSLSHVESKMRISGGEEQPGDRLKYLAVQEMTRELLAASKLIISCPMWNFSVPYVLKQYIDCVVQSELTFRETEHGMEGLLTDRPLLLITSSSQDFSVEPLKKLDFQVPYLKAIFGFIGFRDFRHIYIANTKVHSSKALLEAACERIEEEVARF